MSYSFSKLYHVYVPHSNAYILIFFSFQLSSFLTRDILTRGFVNIFRCQILLCEILSQNVSMHAKEKYFSTHKRFISIQHEHRSKR